MAEYPDAIYAPRTKENKAGVVYDEAKTTVGYAEDIVKDDNEIVAIETELGTNVANGYTNLKTRLLATDHRGIMLIIDGGGSAITTGIKGFIYVPFKCEIERAILLADQTGSIKIDIWKDNYANFPPTDADSVCGGNEPEIVTGIKDDDATLTDWSKDLAEHDILAFNVDSVTDIERLTITLEVRLKA